MKLNHMRLRNDVVLFLGSPSSLAVIEEDHALVIDPGIGAGRGAAILNHLRSRYGVSQGQVLITHAHPDHIAEASQIPWGKHIPGKEYSTALSSVLREVYVYGARAPKDLLRLKAPDLSHDELTPFNPPRSFEGVKAVPIPGHSPGMVGYAVRDQVLYAADSVFGDRLIAKVGVPFYPDHVRALESMNTLKEYVREGYTIVPSHGPVVKGDRALKLIEANTSSLKKVRDAVIGLIRSSGASGMTSQELASRVTRMFASMEPSPELLVLNEVTVRSILSELVDEGLAEMEVGNKGVVWVPR